MAAGVEPRASSPSDAGLTENGRIEGRRDMRTSAEASTPPATSRSPTTPPRAAHLAVEHWGEALNMGEVAGRTIAGEDAQWDVAPGFWSTIGEHTLKYVAWGDGFDETRAGRPRRRRVDGLVRPRRHTVGVLTHERDEDYERGRDAGRERGAPLP